MEEALSRFTVAGAFTLPAPPVGRPPRPPGEKSRAPERRGKARPWKTGPPWGSCLPGSALFFLVCFPGLGPRVVAFPGCLRFLGSWFPGPGSWVPGPAGAFRGGFGPSPVP